MRWKANNKSFLLVLVPPPEGSWIILYMHDKMLRYQFWALMVLVSCRALSPCCGRLPPGHPNPRTPLPLINSVATVLVFHRETEIDSL
jgi:hypothetical protein